MPDEVGEGFSNFARKLKHYYQTANKLESDIGGPLNNQTQEDGVC